MGDPRKKHKKFSRPRRAYDKIRIEDENVLAAKYGLKNKREIWKADEAVKIIRGNAKKLITAGEKEKEAFLARLQKKGYNVKTIGEVLALNKEDLLKRRLQTILVDKQLARSSKEARQLIVHKHVSVSGNKVNIPSYTVNIEEENEIRVERPIINIKEKQEENENTQEGETQ